jgi:hypothetical protein
MKSKQFNTSEREENMLKEIDCDESHSRKQKSFLFTPIMVYIITQQYNASLFEKVFTVLRSCSPPFSPSLNVTYISLLNSSEK